MRWTRRPQESRTQQTVLPLTMQWSLTWKSRSSLLLDLFIYDRAMPQTDHTLIKTRTQISTSPRDRMRRDTASARNACNKEAHLRHKAMSGILYVECKSGDHLRLIEYKTAASVPCLHLPTAIARPHVLGSQSYALHCKFNPFRHLGPVRHEGLRYGGSCRHATPKNAD
jgi:hypothetical protein